MSGPLSFTLAAATATWLLAQAPTPTTPPAVLPPSVTGPTSPPVVIPAGAPVPASAKAAPLDAFSAASHPPETMHVAFGLRGAADWLGKIHQVNGRILPGVNPALAAVWAHDSEATQALALVGLCQAARATGDAVLAAKASQTLLALMANLKPDAADPAKLTVTCAAAERTTVAAGLVLAACELPGADARTLAVAEHMTLYLRTVTESDPLARGLAVRALAASHKIKPADWKRDAAKAAISRAATELKAKPNPILAGCLITAACDLFLVTKDASLRDTVNELADGLCDRQYDRSTVRGGFTWAGAVKGETDTEPTFEQACVATGLAAATTVARHSADATRYAKYRSATVACLMFVRGLQATLDSSSHFESNFRTRSVVGGVRSSVTDGILRADATALAIGAYLRFLESGGEGRE
jgi:hypothetical protein